MSTLSQAILPPDLYANRPTNNSALTEGRLYFATDRNTLYRDTGTTWEAWEMTGVAYAFEWSYLDQTARLAATGFLPEDLYKLGFQVSNKTFWILTSVTPTWEPLVPGTPGAIYLETVSTDASISGDGTPSSPLSAAGPFGHVIKNFNATLPQRSNFKILGADVEDDAAGDTTTMTITGGGGGGITQIYPKSAAMWMDECAVAAGTPGLAKDSAAGYKYGHIIYSSTPALNDRFELGFLIAEGTYTFRASFQSGPLCGIASFSIDAGEVFGTTDLYSAGWVSAGEAVHTGIVLTAGYHKLVVRMLSKNPAASSYRVGMSKLWLVNEAGY